MTIEVSGILLRNAEMRVLSGGAAVQFLIDAGKGMPIEAYQLIGPTADDALCAQRIASQWPRGRRVRAAGDGLRTRTDHDVAAVVLMGARVEGDAAVISSNTGLR